MVPESSSIPAAAGAAQPVDAPSTLRASRLPLLAPEALDNPQLKRDLARYQETADEAAAAQWLSGVSASLGAFLLFALDNGWITEAEAREAVRETSSAHKAAKLANRAAANMAVWIRSETRRYNPAADVPGWVSIALEDAYGDPFEDRHDGACLRLIGLGTLDYHLNLEGLPGELADLVRHGLALLSRTMTEMMEPDEMLLLGPMMILEEELEVYREAEKAGEFDAALRGEVGPHPSLDEGANLCGWDIESAEGLLEVRERLTAWDTEARDANRLASQREQSPEAEAARLVGQLWRLRRVDRVLYSNPWTRFVLRCVRLVRHRLRQGVALSQLRERYVHPVEDMETPLFILHLVATGRPWEEYIADNERDAASQTGETPILRLDLRETAFPAAREILRGMAMTEGLLQYAEQISEGSEETTHA